MNNKKYAKQLARNSMYEWRIIYTTIESLDFSFGKFEYVTTGYIKEIMPSILNMAAMLCLSIQKIAEEIMYSLQTHGSKILMKYGLEFEINLTSHEKLEKVIFELNEKFGNIEE